MKRNELASYIEAIEPAEFSEPLGLHYPELPEAIGLIVQSLREGAWQPGPPPKDAQIDVWYVELSSGSGQRIPDVKWDEQEGWWSDYDDGMMCWSSLHRPGRYEITHWMRVFPPQ